MNVDVSHAKNPAIGWDITVTATADSGEKISFIKVEVNGGKIFSDSFDNLSSFHKTFTQQGQFPGDNTATATVTNDKSEDTTAEDSWE